MKAFSRSRICGVTEGLSRSRKTSLGSFGRVPPESDWRDPVAHQRGLYAG